MQAGLELHVAAELGLSVPVIRQADQRAPAITPSIEPVWHPNPLRSLFTWPASARAAAAPDADMQLLKEVLPLSQRAEVAAGPHLPAGSQHIPLFAAASSGDSAALAGLLGALDATAAAAAAVAAADHFGCTALHYAVCSGSAAAIQLLLAAGANVSARNFRQLSPLHYGAMQPRAELSVLKQLLAADQSACCARDQGGFTPLHYAVARACLCGSPSAVAALLTAAAGAVNSRSSRGHTPLHLAAASHHQPDVQQRVVDMLLASGASPNAPDAEGRTPLHFAAAGATQVLQQLLSAGADPSAASKEGLTPLVIAAQHGKLESCRRLLQRMGPQAAATGQQGRDALKAAADRGHTVVASLLVRHGAVPGLSHLIIAARGGHLALLEMLLEHSNVGAAGLAEVEAVASAAAGCSDAGVVQCLRGKKRTLEAAGLT